MFNGIGLWRKSFEIREATPPVALSKEGKSFSKTVVAKNCDYIFFLNVPLVM